MSSLQAYKVAASTFDKFPVQVQNLTTLAYNTASESLRQNETIRQTTDKVECLENEVWYYKWLVAHRRRRTIERSINSDKLRARLLDTMLEVILEKRKRGALEKEVIMLREWKKEAEECLRKVGLEGVVDGYGGGREMGRKEEDEGELSIISESASRFTETMPWNKGKKKEDGREKKSKGRRSGAVRKQRKGLGGVVAKKITKKDMKRSSAVQLR